MAITTYAELQTALTNWLGRSDLASRYPEFIALAEADMRRNLRDQAAQYVVTLNAGTTYVDLSVAAPGEGAEVRSIAHNSSTRKYPLRQVTMANLTTLMRSGSGTPYYFAVQDDKVYFDIQFDGEYPVVINYFMPMQSLSGTITTNLTLQRSPDIYLFGALKEAELYLEHDERNPIWAQKYQKAIYDENLRRERAELGAAPIVPGLPIIFG